MILCFFFSYCYADEGRSRLQELMAPDILNTLLKEGEVSRIYTPESSLVLFPDIEGKDRILEEVHEIDAVIGVEIALLFHTENKVVNDNKDRLVSIYNILQSISTMQGIEYYSATRKRMRIFYHDAYVINSPGEKKKIDDPQVAVIPGKSSLYAYLEDSSFGNYICHIDYTFNGQAFTMEMQNHTQIWYTIIPLIKPYNLKSYIIIIPLEENILFYGFSCLKTINMFGMARGRIVSLYNRIKAVYDWFRGEYEQQITMDNRESTLKQ
jgi:L-rhamnose mutarotase